MKLYTKANINQRIVLSVNGSVEIRWVVVQLLNKITIISKSKYFHLNCDILFTSSPKSTVISISRLYFYIRTDKMGGFARVRLAFTKIWKILKPANFAGFLLFKSIFLLPSKNF